MLIIDNCFKCPDSRFDINSKKWVCIKHDNLILTDVNLISEIPIVCTRPDFYDISLLKQERMLLMSEILGTLSEETKTIIGMIINNPSEIINNITSVIVGKSNYSKNKRNGKKYICHYCKKEIKNGQKCYDGKLKNVEWGAWITFCESCKKKYGLTEDDFQTNITEQNLMAGIRNKFGWKHKSINKIIKELRVFPDLI